MGNVCLACSLDEYASNGSQSAGAPGRHQVDPALCDGLLSRVQRNADTTDDWSCRQTTGHFHAVTLVHFHHYRVHMTPICKARSRRYKLLQEHCT